LLIFIPLLIKFLQRGANMRRPKNTYERGISGVNHIIMEMGEKVAQELKWSIEALLEHDQKKAEQVMELDKEVDKLDGELDFNVLDLISLQQPATKDLRKLVASLRVGRALERFGDYAVNIAEAAIFLAGTGEYFKPLQDIPKMAAMVDKLLSSSLKAFNDKDLELAERVLKDDDPVDELFLHLHDELIEYMKRGPRYVEQGSYFLLVTRYLERMGDHAVNVAQMANYKVTGDKIYTDRGLTDS